MRINSDITGVLPGCCLALLFFAVQKPQLAAAAQWIPLSLEESLNRGRENNFELQLQRIATALAVEKLNHSTAATSPQLSLGLRRNEEYQARISMDAEEGFREADSFHRSGGFTLGVQKEWQTGLNVLLSSQYSNPVQPDLDYHQVEHGLKIKFPLLKKSTLEQNIGKDEKEWRLKQAEYQNQLGKQLRAIVAAWCDLLTQHQDLLIKEKELLFLDKTLAEALAKMEAGQGKAIESLHAKAAYQSGLVKIQTVQQKVADSSSRLSLLIDQHSDEIQASYKPNTASLDKTVLKLEKKLLMVERPSVTKERLAIDKVQWEIQSAQKKDLPKWDLELEYSTAGWSFGRSEAWNEFQNPEKSGWLISMTFSTPIGSTQSKELTNALYRKQSLVLDQNLQYQKNLTELNELKLKISKFKNLQQQRQENFKTEQTLWKIEQEKFSAGQTTFLTLMKKRELLDTSEFELLKEKLQHLKNLARMAELAGIEIGVDYGT